MAMFRQVIMQTWADGVTPDQKDAMIVTLASLRRIPEVVSASGGVDAGYFADNWGAVSVLEFCDFAAARRYVTHPDHQAFLAQHARPLTAGRAVVQYEWGQGAVVGYHHVKVPVSDVRRSRQWYIDVLGFEPDLEFVEDGELRGAALFHPVAGVRLAVRHDPTRAAALGGFDVTALAVSTRDDLVAVAERARSAGATPGPIQVGTEGWTCDLADPDGLIVRLYTHQRHTSTSHEQAT
jgi:catechol 2,3-dioxygenase-like lactoylglutathione lyase family enzyme